MSQTPPQTQSQTPDLDIFSTTYTCKEDILKYKINRLNQQIGLIREHYDRAKESLEKILNILAQYALYNEYYKLVDAIRDLDNALKDNIEGLIFYEIPYNPDIEKYEKKYKVKFKYDSERQLGVVLVEEKGTVKPVVVWTDYKEVGYLEGERQ
jgi:hypothetical protein